MYLPYFFQIFRTSNKREIAYFHFWRFAPWWPNGESQKVEIRSLSRGYLGAHSYQVSDPWLKRLQNVPYLLNGGATGTFWPLWPWKLGQIKNPEDMWCPLGRSTYHIFFQIFRTIHKGGIAFFVFLTCGPLVAKPGIRKGRNSVSKLRLPRGTCVPSLRSIAPAVTKRATNV